ncbi:MFS transporter [Guyanagaster necrorhizus]|uniref:MFS transporter n=1 Tax=Guyanagaster necrorhizus TaxID=856835 RepID=A0A9P7VM55_9AGAR|nr:MFS transporter [Guyanagaster necrorhizus MCA 3950]KAG7442439.1 MFS transporter [Guyanagaster necrorhizus MCA 3950]
MPTMRPLRPLPPRPLPLRPLPVPPVPVESPPSPTFSFYKPCDDEEIIIEDEYTIDIAAERRLLRRMDLRVVPTSILISALGFLARFNIGNARILKDDNDHSLLRIADLTDHQFLILLVVFLVPFTVFETPSNYMLKHFSPPHWFAILLLGWGASTMIMAASRSYGTLIGLRFLLSSFEAGFFPGMIYFLTFWYRLEERGLRLSLIIASAPLGGAFGGSIAYGVEFINGARGLEAWQWLFIIEGAPSCFLAIIVYLFFPSYPERASWLSSRDRDLAIVRLNQETSKSLGHARITWDGAKSTIKDWRLYLHYIVFTATSVAFSSISLFAPTIVDGLGYRGLDAQLFIVPPFAVAFVVTVAMSWAADRYRAWSMCAMVSMILAGITFIIHGSLPRTSFEARYTMLCLGTMFSYAGSPSLLAWLTGNLRDTNATTLAIPMNVAFGASGQMIGIFLYRSNEAPGYLTGHYTNGAALLVGAVGVGILRVIYARRNRELGVGQSPWIV